MNPVPYGNRNQFFFIHSDFSAHVQRDMSCLITSYPLRGLEGKENKDWETKSGI